MNHCLFCGRQNLPVIAENSLVYAIRDINPVTSLHTLIISKGHYATVFDLPSHALISIHELALQCRADILKLDPAVKGFNFGTNAGTAAGQKISHLHFHLIPRREGDIAPPPALA